VRRKRNGWLPLAGSAFFLGEPVISTASQESKLVSRHSADHTFLMW
jgi:hypothetical protein